MMNGRAVKLILDGQQRITTLYMLMTGKIPPYYKEHEILTDIRNLYVNVETLSLEYYKIKLCRMIRYGSILQKFLMVKSDQRCG